MDSQSETNGIQQAPTDASIAGPLSQTVTKKSNWGKWVFALTIALVLVGVGGYYFLHKSTTKTYTASKNNALPSTTTTSSPTAYPKATNNTLNPNTGNMYSDIKERLNQVIK